MKAFLRFGIVIIIIFCFVPFVQGQSEESAESKWSFNGYLKDLATFNILDDNTLFVDNLIHNRLNFKWYPSDSFSAYLEIRNRFFHGDLVQSLPSYSSFIDVNDDFVDMSINVIDRDNAVLHSMIDRLYIQWNPNDWEIRLGRQRINWGTNLVWNPNDLFNAYSFFDFDYEERPGSDALRIQKYTGFASGIEFAVNMAKTMEDFVGAGMWKINSGGYDMQFIGGVANENVTVGFGWAGNIKTSGFKGEMTFFQPFEVSVSDERAYLVSITWDYSFSNSLYIMWSGLYNSSGTNEPSQLQTLGFTTNRRLAAKNLTPYKFSSIAQASYPVHPLLNAGLAIMLFPGDKAMFIYPTVSWSVVQNLDLDLFGQFFWDDPGDKFESTTKLIFIRAKWSF